jgi:hypothetical protein
MNKLFNHHFVLKFIGRRSCGHLNAFKKSKFNVETFSDFPVNSGKFYKPFSTFPIPCVRDRSWTRTLDLGLMRQVDTIVLPLLASLKNTSLYINSTKELSEAVFLVVCDPSMNEL